MTDASASSLWNSYIERGKSERLRSETGRSVVSREDQAPDITPFGIVRWYMHPDMDDVVDKALYFLELEIPPDSRSGKLHHQGGIVHAVVEGSGYTILDGTRYDWEQTDLIAIPSKVYGVTFQHYNPGPEPARLVMTWPNFDSALGPAMGVAMDVVEPAPEYEEKAKAR